MNINKKILYLNVGIVENASHFLNPQQLATESSTEVKSRFFFNLSGALDMGQSQKLILLQ